MSTIVRMTVARGDFAKVTMLTNELASWEQKQKKGGCISEKNKHCYAVKQTLPNQTNSMKKDWERRFYKVWLLLQNYNN